MEIKVFEGLDGALVVASKPAPSLDELAQAGVLYALGEGCISANSLSDELCSRLYACGHGVAQRVDVGVVLRSITAWAQPKRHL